MKHEDKPRLVAVLLKLQAVFPKDISEHTYEAYYESLAIYKIGFIEQVAKKMIKEQERFPLPVHFINSLNAYRENVFEGNLLADKPTANLSEESKRQFEEDTRAYLDTLTGEEKEKFQAAIDAYRNKGKE